MKPNGLLLGALLLIAIPAAAQGRISNAKIETLAATQGVARAVASVAGRGAVTWVGYSVPVVPGPRQMCCSDSVSSDSSCCGRCRLETGSGVSMTTGESRVRLEPPTEFLVLARVDPAAAPSPVVRVRTFSLDCDIDAGGMPVVWLTNVAADDSIAWLATLVTDQAERETRNHVVNGAIGAIALHNVPAADAALERFVDLRRAEWVRGATAFWLGSARGAAGARLLARMVKNDPSDRVRDKAAFGLSVSGESEALRTLIDEARTDSSAHVRGQALFWLAHKAGEQAVAAIDQAIANDPEVEVKKKAVFALSQLPRDEGVPKLIDVARSNKNPEVRKQAMFWLGQSHDPRAVEFFERILLSK